MLQDDNAIVRVMGLVCFLNKGYEIEEMKGDSCKVLATPFGCVGEEITVEEFSKRMIEDLEFRFCYTDPDKAYEIMNQKHEEYIQQNGGEELLTAPR